VQVVYPASAKLKASLARSGAQPAFLLCEQRQERILHLSHRRSGTGGHSSPILPVSRQRYFRFGQPISRNFLGGATPPIKPALLGPRAAALNQKNQNCDNHYAGNNPDDHDTVHKFSFSPNSMLQLLPIPGRVQESRLAGPIPFPGLR